MRKTFTNLLYEEMKVNKDIYLLTGDLGFNLFEKIRDDFPDRFINVGVAEQVLIGAGIGLALKNKIGVCYSITPFLYRGFEFIRNYANHENIPLKLVGGGIEKDYGNLGSSHHSDDIYDVMNIFPNIEQFYPKKEELNVEYVKNFLYNGKPSFIGLRR